MDRYFNMFEYWPDTGIDIERWRHNQFFIALLYNRTMYNSLIILGLLNSKQLRHTGPNVTDALLSVDVIISVVVAILAIFFSFYNRLFDRSNNM